MPIDSQIYQLQQPVRLNTPFENLNQVLAARNQQETIQNQAMLRQAEAQRQQAETQKLRDQQSDQQAIDAAMSSSTDPNAVIEALRKTNHGHLIPTMQDQFAKAADLNEKAQKAKREAETAENAYASHLASSVLSWKQYGPDAMMNAFQAAAQVAQAHGHDVSQIVQAVQQDPTSLESRMNAIIAMAEGPQKAVNVAPEGTLVTPGYGTQAPNVNYQAPAKPTSMEQKPVLLDGKSALVNYDPKTGKSTDPATGQDVSARVKPIPPASLIINDARQRAGTMPDFALTDARPTGPDANKPDPTIRMTPNGLHQAALNYIATGQYPPTGRGTDPISIAQREAINSKVGAIAAAANLDVPNLRAVYKSNQGSLNSMQKSSDAVQAFMSTADKNAALLETALQKMPDTGSPLLNKPLRAFETSVVGKADMAPIATYLRSVTNEYAKIISSPTMSGVMSDNARHEAEQLLNPNATVQQMIGSIRALNTEGANRVASLGEQIGRIQQRMQIGPPNTQTPANQNAAPSKYKVGDVVTVKGQKLKITAIHPDGTFDADPVK